MACQLVGSGYVEYRCTVRLLPDGTQIKTFEAASGGVPGTTDEGPATGTFMEAIRPDGTYTQVEDDALGAFNPSSTTPPLLARQDLAPFATVFTY